MKRDVDIQYMSELRAAQMMKPRLSANLLLLAIIGCVVWGLWWAAHAPLAEVTKGLGRVIPSTQVQVVQNLEGGIVSDIRVGVGDWVEKGQTLLVIDDTQARSKVREDRSKRLALEAVVQRLQAESDGGVPAFSDDLTKQAPEVVAEEQALFQARATELQASLDVLASQKEQKAQEIVELESRIRQLNKALALGNEELDILRPIVAQGASSRIELLRLQREVNETESSLLAARQSMPRARTALVEIDRQVQERRAAFKSQALAELNQTLVDLRGLRESMTASEDRLRRTEVASPVDGTVKQVLIGTVGGVVQPGMDLVEIVPADDSLLVEARVRPADVAFLRPGQEADVKITAYDYAIYGTLKGEVVTISADTILDEKGESYYAIRVRTRENHLEKGDQVLPIIPGMVAEADILTGNRTVLEYLLKPILRARENALRER